ncbi:homeobox protein knotted-1-like 11 isoform X2 [Phragmites australis]|uniref:homeobox protein knotted-1-like 11 isoform X2 n=1 Tax=Phragmites australis TaxID=29695 RepID=UPI002D79E88A|nr:homeobox protein knotted-1-like 11 isoform X2 [Phragmites australis]
MEASARAINSWRYPSPTSQPQRGIEEVPYHLHLSPSPLDSLPSSSSPLLSPGACLPEPPLRAVPQSPLGRSLSSGSPTGGMAFHYPDHALAMDAAAANLSFASGVGGVGGVGGAGWEREKAAIAAHPLYERLLEAHVACLRVATPVDQLPRIDAQIAARPPHMAATAAGGANSGDEELDLFMTHYVLLLCSFKEQLQQHVRVHAMEAVMACWELEQTLQSLTGASPGEGTGATMSDDEDNQVDSENNMFDGNDASDGMGFGPLMLTEGERSLVERVRQELKHELKQGYREKLVDIREEIMRKRRAGKLPGDTASTLKAWWQAHSKWPYPTEEDKARLVQETGLQLKQINNWFINQRKRNWHNNHASSSSDKSKRKSTAGDGNAEQSW